MKIRILVLAILMLTHISGAVCARTGDHKSQAEIEKLTPQQRVEEYCNEYARHGYRDAAYEKLLAERIKQDGLEAVSYLAKVINEYDPTKPNGKIRENNNRSYAAEGLLSQIDEKAFRLRGSEEGKRAINSIKQLIERMEAANFDSAEGSEYQKQMRYKGTLAHLEHMQGESWFDISIKDTLELKYKIRLSSRELLGFVEHLISQDPAYPKWSDTEWYKDWTDVNEHGVPQQYIIVKNIERFHKAYVEYKKRGAAE